MLQLEDITCVSQNFKNKYINPSFFGGPFKYNRTICSFSGDILINVITVSMSFFTFVSMFLFSLTINSQEVGDEFLANPGVNTTAIDADTGYDAAGTFNNNGNGNYGGWTAGTGGAYATATTNNGECHSPDRMFRLFKTGGPDGQFINQIVTASD